VTNGDWPAPEPHEERSRLPLPRVEDLPVAEQGYDREAVREAFDSFYRHAAQLDATLRTLEAVEVFQRTASELRAEMRTIRAAGWTVSSYGRGGGGYGAARGGGVREWSLPPAFPRVAAEALFLIVIGIIVGVAGWSRIAIVVVMGLALAIVWLVEFVASRERAIPLAAVAPPAPPKLDEEPAELPPVEAAAAQAEDSEAMTILGAEQLPEQPAEPEEEPEPEPQPEPEPEQPPEPIHEAEVEAEVVAEAPPAEEEPEPPAAEPELAAAAVDVGDEIDEAPEVEQAEELPQVAAVDATADDDEDTLSGIEAVSVEPERRRFRLFRRGRDEEDETDAEPPAGAWIVPEEDSAAAPAEPDRAVAETLDPWERGPELEPEREAEPEPELVELVVEPVDEVAPEAELAESEPEPLELVVDAPADAESTEPEAGDEPEQARADLPVEVVAEQAAAALSRSRARRRRPPRRARRR
jgi:hypothetical protein